jgi:hypothetical protein
MPRLKMRVGAGDCGYVYNPFSRVSTVRNYKERLKPYPHLPALPAKARKPLPQRRNTERPLQSERLELSCVEGAGVLSSQAVAELTGGYKQ